MDLFTVVSCIVAIAALYSIMEMLLSRRYFYKQISKFDGPRTLPFIGNAHLFFGSSEDILGKIIELGKVYTDLFRIWFGNRVVVFLNTPEAFKILCLNPKIIERGRLFDFLRPWGGKGLLTVHASGWQVQRKFIQPTLNMSILKSYVKVFVSRSELMIDQMARYIDGPEFEINKFMAAGGLEMICETAIGVKLGDQVDENCIYADAFDDMLAGVNKRIFHPWLHSNFIFDRTQDGKRQQKLIQYLHEFSDTLIEEKKKQILERSASQGLSDSANVECEPNPRRDEFLEHLLQLVDKSDQLSYELLRQEVHTIVAAGSDTTAAVNCWVLLMLASYPDIQEKVYQELYEIYGDDDGDNVKVTADDLPRMQYLECVIKETMRLFPITPILVRDIEENLDIGHRTLPKGCAVLFAIILLHRSEKYWPDPLKFDPDRFLPEELTKQQPYTYLPFGGGPRSCIGSRYGIMSIKTLIATILRKYILKKDNIVPIKDIRIKIEFLLRPVEPITLRIERRTRKDAVP